MTRKAIVTGGAQGLGLEMTKALCEENVTVCILDVSPKLGDTVEALRRNGFNVESVQADLSQIDRIHEFFNEAMEKLEGRLDILVNNAGIHKPMPAEEIGLTDFKKILDVNVVAVFELSRLAKKAMGTGKNGKIINIASVLAVQGGFNAVAYSASKGAVAQLTKSLSNEWAKDGINVNAIAPGYYKTELNTHILTDEDRYKDLVSRVPVGRFGEVQEIKGIIKFLASEQSTFISGAVIPVDGGFLGR